MEVWIIGGAIVVAAAIIGSSIHQAGKLVADRIDNHSRISDEIRQKLGSIHAALSER